MGARPILTGALVAPLFLLAACGDTTSVADPPVSPSTATSSPTQEPKRETPEHFIRRWAKAEQRMENTGDTSLYLRLSRACRACRQLAAQITSFYAAGGFVRWGGWQIRAIDRSGARDGALVFSVEVDSKPTRFKPSASTAIQHLGGGPATHQLAIAFHNGGWHVLSKVQLAT